MAIIFSSRLDWSDFILDEDRYLKIAPRLSFRWLDNISDHKLELPDVAVNYHKDTKYALHFTFYTRPLPMEQTFTRS